MKNEEEDYAIIVNAHEAAYQLADLLSRQMLLSELVCRMFRKQVKNPASVRNGHNHFQWVVNTPRTTNYNTWF